MIVPLPVLGWSKRPRDASDGPRARERLDGPQKVSIELIREREPMTVQATLGRARELPKDRI
jgi:hypothetical protein